MHGFLSEFGDEHYRNQVQVPVYEAIHSEFGDSELPFPMLNDLFADFYSRQDERRKLEKQWELDLEFLAGNQYCEISPRGEVEEEEKPQLKSCNLIPESNLVVALYSFEGIFFAIAESYLFFFQPDTRS